MGCGCQQTTRIKTVLVHRGEDVENHRTHGLLMAYFS